MTLINNIECFVKCKMKFRWVLPNYWNPIFASAWIKKSFQKYA